MSAHTARPAVDLAPSAPAWPGPRARAALGAGSRSITWEPPGLTGAGVGIAAIVLGLQARFRLAGAKGTRMATVAVAVATLAVLSVVLFLIVGAPD